MSRAVETLEAFLSGRIAQDELLQRLQADVAADAAAGGAWLQAIKSTGLRQSLSPELLARINAIATPGDQTLLRPEAHARTEPAPPLKPQDDTTRIRPVQELYASPGQTRLRPQGPVPAGADAADTGMVIRDRYVLQTILGQGGMGQVWKARDQLREQAHPFVALKLLSPDFEAHPDAYAALQSEAAKSQQLAHPNIATVFDFDLDRSAGRAFLTMELLEGQTLESYIRSAPSGHPRAQVLPILRGLAAGLAYAHTRKIVHSDFKPANVFLTDTGTAKILDFGIARVAREGQRVDEGFHAESLAALTMAYASPEMFRGDDAHPADDIYALGIVAYELLTGSHPFKRQRADKAAAQGLVPVRIKGLKSREWRAIQRSLSFDRATRWPDAAAFLKSLDGINPWIKALGATAVVLASVAAWSGYQNYLESKPQVPFSALAPEIQREFQQAMSEGNDALDFGTTRVTGPEATSALYREAFGSFASAYALHPKNPEADAGMRKTLDALSKQLQTADADTRTEARAVLAEYSSRYTVLSKYGPLNKLLRELD
jgi:serine/threonine protein kinase